LAPRESTTFKGFVPCAPCSKNVFFHGKPAAAYQSGESKNSLASEYRESMTSGRTGIARDKAVIFRVWLQFALELPHPEDELRVCTVASVL
jgi:hypothetical protein